ncbi:MAG TPA: ATP-binding protein [Planctomycetota bacterium]|nr:ATP-binding protein [Planctomycetota bacterium]
MKSTPEAGPASGPAGGPGGELEQAMRSLSAVGLQLAGSYEALERRAQRVEDELCRKLEELDAVTRHLEAILEALPTGVLVRDAGGKIVRANRAALAITALEAGELIGRRSHPLLEAGQGQGAQPNGGWLEREVARADGRRLVLASRRSPIHSGNPGHQGPRDGGAGDAGRSPAGSVEILDDRTELVELSERLHGLDKLAALGNMAGGIAHELRNPMHAVKGFAALLAQRLEPLTQEQRWAARIVEGVGEAETVLSSMLSLAAPEKLVLESVDGADLVESALALAVSEVEPKGSAERWRVERRIELSRFAGDRIKLRQALRNLVANAFQAQPAGGRVDIALALEEGQVALRVADAGPGVPPGLRRRALEPFFTTRAEGTGLGLSLVATIAELHGGRLEIEAERSPLGGASVLVRFPFRNRA